jgi:hypothetical protein
VNKIVFCIIAFISIISPIVQAQQVNNAYDGVVISSASGNKLENVICQGIDKKKEIVYYTFSDQEGHFAIEKSDNIEYLQFKLLGYSALTLSKKQFELANNHIIELFESSIPLEEVVVQVPPIQNVNDTLRYNVNSFKTQGDRYVSDVLKKLPGIKVADNGTISYMGESINKFYIEGRDLLGGQYNIATNNLDINAISSIEVLQNNQHIKALKGIDFEEKSAINIKLKKGHKARPFGNIQLGAGGTPFLYDGKGLASYISENQQSIVSIKGQNNGNAILNEIEDKLNFDDLFSYEAVISPFVTAPSARSIPLPTNRHLFNNTYLGSANTLIPLSKDSELRLNVAYGNDKTDQDFYLLQSIATEGDYIHISESSKQKESTKNLRTSVSYELNSLSKYIKDEVLYSRKNKDIYSNMNTNSDNVNIFGLNAVQYIQNNFHGLFKAENEQTIHINSLLRFESNKDELDKDNTITNDISELFKSKYFITKNKIGTSFNVLKNKLNIDLIATYRQKDITNSWVYQEKGAKQHTKIKRLQIGLDPTYQIKNSSKNLFISIKLPISYDNYSTSDISNEKIIFSPSISNTWQINHKWETFIRIGYSYDYANDISLLDSPYFTGYRSIYIPNNALNHNSRVYLASRIQYKDIVNMFFFSMNAIYRLEDCNYINAFYITDEYSYYTTKQQNDKGNILSITADVSKTFTKSRLALGLIPSYTMVKSNIFQQDIMTKNNSHIASVSTKIDWKPIKNVNIIYNTTGRISWNNNNLTETRPLKDLTQNFRLFYFPTKSIDLLMDYDYVIYENTANKYSDFFFLNIKGIYKHKRIEYELALNNILNNNLFSISELSSVNIYNQQIPLRQREFLFSVKFNF